MAAVVERTAPTRPVRLIYMTDEGSLADTVRALQADGHRSAEVVAALLSPGGRHVKRDLPEMVEAARGAAPDFDLRLRPGALGDDPGVVAALARAVLEGASQTDR